MNIYKITLQREVNRPRLAMFQPYLEIVTFIRAINLKHADDIAKDIKKEHSFMDHSVERVREKEFREEMEDFIGTD